MTTASRSEIPEGRILICICTRYTIKYLPYPAFGTKISGFLIKSLPKISENNVKMAFCVYKKAEDEHHRNGEDQKKREEYFDVKLAQLHGVSKNI